MRYRTNISLSWSQGDEIRAELEKKLKKKIGQTPAKIEIIKESIDARNKADIRKSYTVDFDVERKLKGFDPAPDMTYHPKELKRASDKRPVVVGFGPAGMFAALIMAQAGLKPIVLERGQDVEKRTEAVERFWNEGVLDTESNVQFGEGGAGTFSDGKLTTGIKDIRIRKVLYELCYHGAPEEIMYKAKPHVGTDVLKNVVRGIREDIISLGGEVRFNSKLVGLEISDIQVSGVKVETTTKDGGANETGTKGGGTPETNLTAIETIPTDTVVLAIGHSARDTFAWLSELGIGMTQKPFSMGVRIEHPQDLIDTAQFGKPARELGLPVADYKLSHRLENGRGVYTFCMCPGGYVIVASSEEGRLTTNGMSNHGRNSGVANSAVLVDVRTEDFGADDPLAGVRFQQKYESLAYLAGLEQARKKLGIEKPYYAPNCTWNEMNLEEGDSGFVMESLPDFVYEGIREGVPAFARKIKGFDSPETKITAIEARSSSPVRFDRNESFEGSMNYGAKVLHGFYPIGEGAGYAGGIMSAAVDGIRIAEHIISAE